MGNVLHRKHKKLYKRNFKCKICKNTYEKTYSRDENLCDSCNYLNADCEVDFFEADRYVPSQFQTI